MLHKLICMLKLQEEMNCKIDTSWRENNLEWYRAIWIESAELMDHVGWKWWKKQTPDDNQIQLEIIDIWHFGLSMLLQKQSNMNLIANELLIKFTQLKPHKQNLLECTELFVTDLLATRQFNIHHFSDLLTAANMTFDDLFSCYIGKNVLNKFRQDYGYKQGTYVKIWNNKEDNEHLSDLIKNLDHASATFQQDIYNSLKASYEKNINTKF